MDALDIGREKNGRGGSRAGRLLVQAVLLALLAGIGPADAGDVVAPFDSTADTVFDIIRADDPTSFRCLNYQGRGARQIWDKRLDGEPVVEAFLFHAEYADGSLIEMAVNPEFGTVEQARVEAMRYAGPLGRFPTLLLNGVKRFSIHGGEQSFHAGTGQIVVYAEKATLRLEQKHLEESLFHEAVHASLDDAHRQSPAWKDAQARDGRFLTSYAASSPEREDLAETALFAFALLHVPDRFPPVDSQVVRSIVPLRLAYIERLFPRGTPPIRDNTRFSPCFGEHS
jgi:hypothetical protein